MRRIDIQTLAATIEDALIDNFDYDHGTSTVSLTKENYYVDIEYDSTTGKAAACIGGNKTNMELPNIEKALLDAIDFTKVLNEVHLTFAEMESEFDMRYEMTEKMRYSALYR